MCLMKFLFFVCVYNRLPLQYKLHISIVNHTISVVMRSIAISFFHRNSIEMSTFVSSSVRLDVDIRIGAHAGYFGFGS